MDHRSFWYQDRKQRCIQFHVKILIETYTIRVVLPLMHLKTGSYVSPCTSAEVVYRGSHPSWYDFWIISCISDHPYFGMKM